MNETYDCLYCKSPCEIKEENGKYYQDCKQCGKKELTKLGLARLRERK